MKFDWSSCAVGVIAGIGAILCVIFAAQLDVFVDTLVCAGDENGLTCARNWANAIAIVAAAGTIYFLSRQLREQAKQTAFVIGDAEPTFDAFSDGFVTTYFRVTNWNRRSFLISHIECVETNAIIIDRVRLLHRPSDEILKDNSPRFSPEIRVGAFVDRSKSPKECFIYADIYGWSGRNSDVFTFKLYGRLLGEEHRNLVLTARTTIDTI